MMDTLFLGLPRRAVGAAQEVAARVSDSAILVASGLIELSGGVARALRAHAERYWASYVLWTTGVVAFAAAATLSSAALTATAVRRWGPERPQTYELHFDFGSVRPVAAAALTGRGTPPLGAAGRSYAVSVRLVMPESPGNVNHGMFVVAANITSQRGDVVATVSRSTTMRYKGWIETMTFGMARVLPEMVGLVERGQSVDVPLFDHVAETFTEPLSTAVVQLSSRRIALYSAYLHLQPNLSGLSSLLQSHFYVTLVALFGVFMAAHVAVGFIGLLYLMIRSASLGETPPPSPEAAATEMHALGAPPARGAAAAAMAAQQVHRRRTLLASSSSSSVHTDG
eukprot:m51a1_g1467 hypothetical protein (340) ;mRNA; r:236180-237693